MSAGTAQPLELELLEEQWVTARQVRLRLRSAALGRAAEVRILLPPAGGVVLSPLLLLLHGADATHGDWDRGVGIIARCRDLPAMVVMPEGGEVGFCTDWLRRERPVRGRIGSTWAARIAPAWERFHLLELLPWVTRRFGASERRVVLGISMGGHGAIAYTARHPGTFAAAASFSGVLDTLGRGIPSLIAAALLYHRQHRHALWGSPLIRRELWGGPQPAGSRRGVARRSAVPVTRRRSPVPRRPRLRRRGPGPRASDRPLHRGDGVAPG